MNAGRLASSEAACTLPLGVRNMLLLRPPPLWQLDCLGVVPRVDLHGDAHIIVAALPAAAIPSIGIACDGGVNLYSGRPLAACVRLLRRRAQLHRMGHVRRH